jgi:hypothetical protein
MKPSPIFERLRILESRVTVDERFMIVTQFRFVKWNPLTYLFVLFFFPLVLVLTGYKSALSVLILFKRWI